MAGSDTTPLLKLSESNSVPLDFTKVPVDVQICPTWSLPNEKTGWGPSCGCPHYSYFTAVVAPTKEKGEYTETLALIKRKTKLVVDALMHHILEKRLNESHSLKDKGSIDSRTDYVQFKQLLMDAAAATERFIKSTGPQEAAVSINVHEGYVGTAKSCNRCPFEDFLTTFSTSTYIKADDPVAFAPTSDDAVKFTINA